MYNETYFQRLYGWKYQSERMNTMEYIKLLGIVIVILGFALKLNSILIIMSACIVTALVSGMDITTFLETLGNSFVSNRSMCTFIIVMLVTGTLERNGLKLGASALMGKMKNASAGIVLGVYGVFRMLFAAFNVEFGGVAGFVRPIVLPMASAAAEKKHKALSSQHQEQLKGMSAGIENVAMFFGQVLFVGGSGMLLVQGTYKDLGYDVSLVELAKTQIPVALMALFVAITYYIIKNKRLETQDEQKEETS